MLIESSVQKLIDPPNASRQNSITAAYINALTMLPPRSSKTRRGERSAVRIVVIADLTGGSTIFRSFGTLKMSTVGDPDEHRGEDGELHDVVDGDLAGVDRRGRQGERHDEEQRAAKMLPTLASSPPDATADARSTPCFWRKRICAAMPPTAGTARFENDIDSWSSAVRTSGSLIGTVPISEIAVAKFVRNEMTIATASHAHSAFLIVS